MEKWFVLQREREREGGGDTGMDSTIITLWGSDTLHMD